MELLQGCYQSRYDGNIDGNLGEDVQLDIRATIAKLNELVVKDGLTQMYNKNLLDSYPRDN